MLNYVETAHSSTIVPLISQRQGQQDATRYVSSVFSYVIGPLDPAHITSVPVHLSTGEEYTLLVPVQWPSSLLTHPAWKDGYEWGYLEGSPQEEKWAVPKLVNEVYSMLSELCNDADPDVYPWTFGFLLGVLASMAERDKILALTGLAHACFLLPLFTQERPADWPRYEPYHASFLHDRVVKAYRARVRVYRQQGKSFDEAQRLALAGSMREEMCSKEGTR
jgi:hypothetical protein